MKTFRPPRAKIGTLDEIVRARGAHRAEGRRVALTNGCFDLLHAGHLHTLTHAREAADALIVAVNSDASVRELKGAGRPIIPQDERAEVLASFSCVDHVLIFDELNPLRVVETLLPDFLVKGGDWAEDAVIGRAELEAAGGRVLRVPPLPGRSTTDIIGKILRSG